ncbi:hypothetical protein KR074_003908 [Drosophila pseudoananassae]|nr:hypothetical protein KR074_003908 [Drosophila pseudoananassae]
MQNTICEPFTAWPMKFDIDKVAQEFKPEEQKLKEAEQKTAKDFLHLPDDNWVILPIFKHKLEHMRAVLSTRQNPYLRCRYRNFLNNVPSKYVTISIYGSNATNMPKPRRKSLNGQFYGVDYKLAPIPVVADPR